MIIERLKIMAFPAGGEQMGRALASLTGPTEVLPGCLSCSVFRTFHDKDELLVEMDWASREDLIRHLQSDVYKQLLLLLELSAKPPEVRFYTVQEFRGLDLVHAVRSSTEPPQH